MTIRNIFFDHVIDVDSEVIIMRNDKAVYNTARNDNLLNLKVKSFKAQDDCVVLVC